MTQVLAFPFRIDPVSGRADTVTVGSEREAADAIAMLAMTRLGERELAPGFGTRDPAYTENVDIAGEIAAGLVLWGPDDVDVSSQSILYDPDTGIAEVSIVFSLGGAS